MPNPTIRDVARAAGVHPGTASRALNSELAGRITPATTQRVKEAAARLGYIPDQLGRSLRTRRSHTVAVLVPDLGNPVFPPIVRGIEDTIREAGYEAVIANTDDSQDREARLINVLTARHCDGFIVASSRLDDPAVATLRESSIPVVLVNRIMEGAVASVVSDDAAGVHAAVEHLVGLGHKEIAHVTGPPELSMTEVRRCAFENAMRAAGVPVRKKLIEAAARYAVDEGCEAFTRILRRRTPTAVVAGNDMIAIGCCVALRNSGLRCPSDVSVVGFNDMPLAGLLDPPLTTVAIPQHDIGAAAAEVVLELIRGGTPEQRVLPVELVIRESTRSPQTL
ncbi:LacI family DNA-binding transcriptional regulator [Mycolicibacterium sp. BiH015]|uniref:LacI family DNA-binding transcriptional regulator n=1 Tax=Mycolicibacterium sp. BiH015 TaxID=3018808 RepID=UPI0022E4673E|nr:LacI family DNA-binding transcriptional regulator [Mycolicibacterium sp. BiH015]MDA2893452.1 LacI family DNA-binding transcriptional regulator [Mycolicibacterium sp. BiH015]